MIDLTGRVAIVTGASRGIGRAVAMELATVGASTVVAARANHAEEVALEIIANGGQSHAVSADVTDQGDVKRMVGSTLERFGRVDILVNNAGVVNDQLVLRMKRAAWDDVLETNLTAVFTCTQTVLHQMLKQRSGRIINISSVVGQTGNSGQANYAASKAGLIGFAKSVAKEVASRGITVNVVVPGLIETDMTRDVIEGAQKSWASNIPLGRPGTPADVAGAVCFLASDKAAYITGQVLGVNGGLYM